MYCPQCGTEYRPGYSSCSDCHVALVSVPPKQSEAEKGRPFRPLWQGQNPRVHAALSELMEKSSIPTKTVRQEDFLFHTRSRPPLILAVPVAFFEKAEAAVKDAFESNDELRLAFGFPASGIQETLEDFERDWSAELPEPPGEQEQASEAAGDYDPDNWLPDDATVEVWQGTERDVAEMLLLSLNENQIHRRCEDREGEMVIRVLPNDEERAREIVREVVEGAPPE